MHFNYVFFDGILEYNRVARSEAEQLDNFTAIECGNSLNHANKLLNILFRLHMSPRINKFINLPLKKMWNKKYIGDICFPQQKPVCFLFSTSLTLFFNMKTFTYLRKSYPGCKIVLMLRDKIEVCFSHLSNITLESLKTIFDEIYSINSVDVEKYGLKSINVMCSKVDVPMKEGLLPSDIVFVGKMKDRVECINEIYDCFSANGLKCDFTLFDDGTSCQVSPGIRVINEYMSYSEMLQRTCQSRCILEITQKGINSVSSRFLEALCYNKKLITDVKSVKESKYYNPDYIHIIDGVDSIDWSFVTKDITVDYKYDNFYSPINMLQFIDDDLASISNMIH